VHQIEDLVTALEETKRKVSDKDASNENLQSKINVIENDVARYQSEKIKMESMIKDTKKKHVDEVHKLKDEVKALNKLFKEKEKANYDLSKNLEIAREAVKKIKLVKSALKTKITKLEANVKKSEKQLIKKNKPVEATKEEVSDAIENNNNILKSETLETNVGKSIAVLNSSVSICPCPVYSELSSSMLTHWIPNNTKYFQDSSSITSMIAHCAEKEKLLSKSEFRQMWKEFLEQIRKDRAEILAEFIK